ncbi:MAG: PocR ligand-binding domain-containing protein [Victivallales bacterium]
MKPNIDFEHLAGSGKFAEFTKLLMKLTGLVMALNSPEGIIRDAFSAKGGSPLCRLFRDSHEGLRRCTNCDRRYHKKAVQDSKPQLYTCHAGFLDMAVPVFIQGRHVATISSGQVLPEPPSELGFKRLLKRISWLDCPEPVLKRAYFKSPYLPREKIRYVMELLELFAWQLCDSLQKIKELEAKLDRDEIRRAKEHISEHFHNPSLGLSDVAAHVGLSPAHFSHVFKQESGMSFVRFVQGNRVAEAKKLMTGTSRSITEICFSCGFNSVTNFNRVFRNIEHCSPRQFRKKLVVGNKS